MQAAQKQEQELLASAGVQRHAIEWTAVLSSALHGCIESQMTWQLMETAACSSDHIDDIHMQFQQTYRKLAHPGTATHAHLKAHVKVTMNDTKALSGCHAPATQ